uniref:Cadherin domain-containing protein n=1 Tax=Xiphophorus couchianus TaxID=32473 RepID=A0A3B5KYA4_9TELE
MTKTKGSRDWRWKALWWNQLFLLWSTIEAQTRYSIPEELKPGSVVGNLAKDLGFSLSEIFDRKLRVASEAGEQYFSVDAGKGELVVNDRIDREALCGQSASCVLTLQIVIDKPLQLYRVEVEIQDSAAAGTHFPLETAQDLDVGVNSVRSYTLSKDEFFSLKIKEVSGGKRVPELALSKSIDREKKPTHTLTLTAVDGGNPVRSGTCQITINVLDNNDNFPAFEKSIYKVSIGENALKGAPVLTLAAKDADEGLNGEVEFAFGAHTPDNVRSVFDIDPLTGEIRLIGHLDFETNSNYEIDISATDKGSPRMEGHCTVHVEVLDVNDNPPNIFLTSQPNSVPENSPSGTVVALISARDVDTGDNSKVILHLNKNVPFKLKASFSDNYALITNGPLDREKFSEYEVEITATDLGSPPMSSKKTINVNITDVNDNPPVFTQFTYSRMPRSAKAGHLVTKVTAVDADSGHNAWISYRLAEATDASLFTVNQYTGEVRTKRAVYEQDDSSQRLLIEIKDDGQPVQSATATVSILLEDGLHEPILDLRHKMSEPSKKTGRITLYLILSLASVSVLSLVTFLILAVKCIRGSRSSGSCCMRRSDCDDYKNPNRNLQIQLNTDGPIKYVEVLGGDMMSQSQSFRSCMSPMSEYSDFTLIKPSSTTDFKEVISVLDASLPDSTWTFESQQVKIKDRNRKEKHSLDQNL